MWVKDGVGQSLRWSTFDPFPQRLDVSPQFGFVSIVLQQIGAFVGSGLAALTPTADSDQV
jgi:hypothetical protein